MWKLIPKVTLVTVALVSGLVYANGNDGFEQDKAHRMLRRRGRRRRGGGGFFSTLSRLGNTVGNVANGVSNAVDSIGNFFGGGDDDDDRELMLTEADVRQEFAAMTEDDRELVFGALARLAPTIARGAVRYGPDIVQGISSLFGGDMTEDDRELILSEADVQKLSQDMNQNYKGMTVDDRALFFSALARLAPRIARAAVRYGPDIADAASNLLGGGSNDEDDRELILFNEELTEDQLQELIQHVDNMSKDDRELFFSRIGSALSSAARSVGNAASSAARSVGNAASSVAGALPGIARTAANVGRAIPGAIQTGMNYARQGVDTYNNARDSISGAIDAVNPGLSDTFDSYVPEIPSDANDSVEAF